MSTQVLLNPIGSGGDVFPFLALGQELQRRGHHVGVMTNPLFQRDVGEAGMEFIKIGSQDALRAVGTSQGVHQRNVAWKLALRWGALGTMRESFEFLSERRKKCPTVMVASPLGFGARIASEKFGIPLVTIALSPFILRSAQHSPVVAPMWLSDWIPKPIKRIQFWFADRLVIDPILKKDVNGLRRQIGLAPTGRFLNQWCFSKELVLAAFPELFAPRQPDWPGNLHFTGHCVWDRKPSTKLANGLDHFLNRSTKPIIVMAGSAGPDSIDFYPAWIDATRKLGQPMIILEQNMRLVPDQLPSHVFRAKYFPIDQILHRSSAVVHSGGIGTTLRSMAGAVPQLIIPKVNDQPDNARRVQNLGAGLLMHHEMVSVDSICNFLNRLLSDRKILENCKNYQDSLSTANAVSISCDLIESLFSRY